MKTMIGKLIIKSMDQRTFTGFISVEDVDLENDLILIDAIDAGMEPYLKSGGAIQAVHSNIPVGRVISHHVTTDPDTGKPAVAFFGEIFNFGRSIPTAIWEEMLTNPSSVGFSIGARPLSERTSYQDGKEIRIIDKLEVYEFSVIADIGITKTPPTPANSGAKLLGLGHSTEYLNVSRPITVKMVLQTMPGENENTDKTDTSKEETVNADDTVDSKSGVDKEEILSRLQKELESKVGGQEAIAALQEEKQKVAILTKQLNNVNRKVEDLTKELTRSKKDKVELLNKTTTLEVERQFWHDAAMQGDNTKVILSKMINEGNAAVNEGGVPIMNKANNARSKTNTKTDKETVETVNKFLTSEIAIPGDQEFLKVIRAMKNMGGR